MQKEKITKILNTAEEIPALPQVGAPGFFEFNSGFETQKEKAARELGIVALATTVSFESGLGGSDTSLSPELEKDALKLNEFALENLESMNFDNEQKKQALDLLNSNNPETLHARSVVESVLGDDLLVEYVSRRNPSQLDSLDINYELMMDTKSNLVDIINYADDDNYRHNIDRFNQFFDSTNHAYIQARDSGYPEGLLVEDRLSIFSRYAGNSIPVGKSLVEHSIDKSLINFTVAAELGEGASVLRETDPDIAKTILQSEAYRRGNIEGYDKLDSEKCLEIAKSIEQIKNHDNEDIVNSGLRALKLNMGEGYQADIHVVQFVNSLISNKKLDSIINHESLEVFARDEVVRFKDSDSEESFIDGIEDFISWSHESGYNQENNFPAGRYISEVAYGISRSRSPETLVSNFKNLEFIGRLENNSKTDDVEEYKEEILLNLLSNSSEWVINNPEMVNNTYVIYNSQEHKQENDFKLLLATKQKLSQDFLVFSDEYQNQVDSHFNEIYSKYINRTDKDGNRFDSVWSIYNAVDDSYRYRNDRGLNPETLEWFDTTSQLPMFAYSSVARMRSEAVVNGIEDNPEEIYNFVYNNPEMVSRLSNINRDEYIKSSLVKDYEYVDTFLPGIKTNRRISDQEKFDQLQERAIREAHLREDSFRTFINLSEDTLKLVTSGDMQLKSILDAGVEVNHGDVYNARRSGVEVALGIRSMNGDDPHPIYGSAGFVDRGYPDGAWGYGEVMLVFDDEDMNSRSTFTAADSFRGADRLTRGDAMVVRAAKDINRVGHTKTSDYVEVQVRGSVDISKAEKICVEDYSTAESLRQLLPDELHSRIIVRPIDRNLK